MNNVIYGAFDPTIRAMVLSFHFQKEIFRFKSAQDVSKETGVRLSVVKAIIKRRDKIAVELGINS